MMYISGAKFEEHCSYASNDIPNLVFLYFSGMMFHLIWILWYKNLNISRLEQEDHSQGKRYCSLFWKALNM